MTAPCALFADLRRLVAIEPWPDRPFSTAYIVTSDPATARDFLTYHATALKGIPQITCEITHVDTLPFLSSQPSITRLSLPYAWIDHSVLHSGKRIDAIVNWDHRRKPAFYHDQIDALIANDVTHVSVYGLQDFDVWQNVQTHVNKHGYHFYERFHAAKPGHESPYQNHLAAFGDVIAFGGWSRLTENTITCVKGPRGRSWTTRDPQTRHEERVLLGMNNRTGLPLTNFSQHTIQSAVSAGLAVINNDRLRPTDNGLWQSTELVSLLV